MTPAGPDVGCCRITGAGMCCPTLDAMAAAIDTFGHQNGRNTCNKSRRQRGRYPVHFGSNPIKRRNREASCCAPHTITWLTVSASRCSVTQNMRGRDFLGQGADDAGIHDHLGIDPGNCASSGLHRSGRSCSGRSRKGRETHGPTSCDPSRHGSLAVLADRPAHPLPARIGLVGRLSLCRMQ